MPRLRLRMLHGLLAFGGTALVGCSGGEPTQPDTTVIVIAVSTAGQRVDPDGYVLLLDGTDSVAAELSDTVTFAAVSVGEPHRVELRGLAPNCGLDRPNPWDVPVGGSDTAFVSVTCYWPPLSGRIAFTCLGGDICVMNADGSGVQNLTSHPAVDQSPGWSPDGRRIAFISYRDDPGGGGDIYVMEADGSGVQNLSRHPAVDGFPAWSPDGTRIAFVSDRGSGEPEIYVMNQDGTGVSKLTPDSILEFHRPAWAPDGKSLAFTNSPPPDDPYIIGGLEVVIMRLDGGGVTSVTGGYAPAWSRDGARLAFLTGYPGFGGPDCWAGVGVVNPDGSGRLILWPGSSENDPIAGPTWSPDGTKVAFGSRGGGNNWISVVPSDRAYSDCEVVTRPDTLGLIVLALGGDPDWTP